MNINRLLRAATCFLAIRTGYGQTLIDLSTQVKNIDFSNLSATKPFKSGASLPVSCSTGEVFFKTDAAPGSNFYGCLENSVWALQSAAGGFGLARKSNTQIELSTGMFRFGNAVTTIGNSSTLTLSGTPSGTVWIYAVATGSMVAGHNLGAALLSVVGNGYVVDATATAFPSSAIPFYRCTVVSGAWPSTCVDMRSPFAAETVIAGPTGALTVDCTAGSSCVIDLLQSVVPTKSGVNDFTGLNTFQRLKLPTATSLTSTECDEAGEEGRLFINTSSPSGQQLYVCEGAAGWKPSNGQTVSTQSANRVYAGPTAGGPALPDFRILAATDIPGHNHAGTEISTGTIGNARTTATSANSNSAIVARDGSGGFSAGTITASLVGNASTATALASDPADCPVNTVAAGIGADGAAACTSVSGAAFNTQPANMVLAGPVGGAAVTPEFRALTSQDMPRFNNTTGYLSTVHNIAMANVIMSGVNNEVRLVMFTLPYKFAAGRAALSVAVAAAAAVGRIGIYDSLCNLVFQSGNLDLSVVGLRTSVFPEVVLQPGVYYWAWASSNSTVTATGLAGSTSNQVILNAGSTPVIAKAANALDGNGLPSSCGTLTGVIAMPTPAIGLLP